MEDLDPMEEESETLAPVQESAGTSRGGELGEDVEASLAASKERKSWGMDGGFKF